MNNEPQTSVYQKGQTPNMLGEAYRPIGKTNFQFQDFLNDEKNKVEEVNLLLFYLFITMKRILLVYID